MATVLPSQITNPAELEAVLLQLMVPNSETIRTAESIVRNFSKNSQCVAAFMQQITMSQNPMVRQMAAVLLRTRITMYWTQLGAEFQEQIKAAFLDVLAKETNALVRNSVCNLVTVIAKYTVPSGQWPALQGFLTTCVASPEAAHREIGMLLFANLTESIGTFMKSGMQGLVDILHNGLNDPQSAAVRINALKGVRAIVRVVENATEVGLIQKLLPSMLTIIQQCLSAGDEDLAVSAFEIFEDLVELQVGFFDNNIPPLVQFMLEVATNTTYENGTREKALTFVSWVISFKPKLVTKQNMIPQILPVVFTVLAEPEEETNDEFDTSPSKTAAIVLDELSLNIPNKYVYAPVMDIISKNYNSPNPLVRKSCLTAVAILAEGCGDPMLEHLGQLIQLVISGYNDPEQQVREVACYAMANFSEYLQPDILDHYETILPAVFKSLDDPSDAVQEKAIFTLNFICEHLGEKLQPFIKPLMDRFLYVLQSSNKRRTQELALSAISSVAMAAGKHFAEFFPGVLQIVTTAMQMTNDEDLNLRTRAVECAGTVVSVIGKELAFPHADNLMKLAVAGMELDYPELREYTYGFYANLAGVIGEHFALYFEAPQVISKIFETLASEEGIEQTIETTEEENKAAFMNEADDDQVANANAKAEKLRQQNRKRKKNASGATNEDGEQISDDSDPEDEEDVDEDEEELDDDSFDYRKTKLRIRTSFLDEKSAGVHALGAFAKHCPVGFQPYVERTFTLLSDLAVYFHEGVRLNVMVALKETLSCYAHGRPGAEKLQAVVNSIIDIYIATMEEDDDKETVAAACDAVTEVMKEMGRAAIEPHLGSLMEVVLQLFKQKAPCQRYGSDDEEDADDEQDHDHVLIDSVAEMVDEIGRGYGPDFEPHFRGLFPELLKYTREKRPEADRVMSIGTLAELANSLKHAIVPYVPKYLPFINNGLKSNNMNIRRNAVYGVGVLCLVAPQQLQPHLAEILQLLYPCFSTADIDGAVLDNACGAVARIIIAHHNVVPLEQVIPVFVSKLPLRDDHQENQSVYQALFMLLQANHPKILPFLPQIVALFKQELTSTHVPQDIKNQMLAVVQSA